MKKILLVLLLSLVGISPSFGWWWSPPDLGPDFYDRGFARGDLLNYKFHQLASWVSDVFIISASGSVLIPASEPIQIWFDMSAGASVASWPAASMTYESGVDNLSVFVDGIYQTHLYCWTETSSTSVTFDSALPVDARVAVIRNMFWQVGTPVETAARVRVTLTTATSTVSWAVWQMQYTMGDDRLMVFTDGVYQDPSNFSEVSSTSINLDSPGLVGMNVDLIRLY